MLKVGIIGLGNIGVDAHLAAYEKIAKENGPVEVVAVCDEVQARLDEVREKGHSFREYHTIDEMLEAEKGKLDYVDICLPTYLHSPIAIKAMEKGFKLEEEDEKSEACSRDCPSDERSLYALDFIFKIECHSCEVH